MKEIKVSLLSRNNFAPYGQIVDLEDLGPATINTGVVKFWKQQVEVNFDGEIEIGVLKVKKHEMLFDVLENHFKTPTIMMSLNGDFLFPVAPCKDEVPDVDEIKVFKMKENLLYMMNSKCWHGEVYPIDKEELTLLVFLKKGSLDDDTVFENLSEQCKIVE
ncbi:MAG: ureidoglycolate lyase [Pedobacter sp.]|jgi:ureidoglycolate hydrolase